MKKFVTDQRKQLVLEIVNNLGASSSAGQAATGQAATLTAQHVARVPLRYADFQTARDETWWWGVRTGRLSPDLDSHEMRVIPGAEAGVGIMDGYVIELTADGHSYRRAFTNRSMASVADRKLLEMAANKESEVSLDDQYSYYITSVPADDDDPLDNMAMNVKSCREPLVFEQARLADYMTHSNPLLGVSQPPPQPKETPMPIFVSQEVWQESKAAGPSRRRAGIGCPVQRAAVPGHRLAGSVFATRSLLGSGTCGRREAGRHVHGRNVDARPQSA